MCDGAYTEIVEDSRLNVLRNKTSKDSRVVKLFYCGLGETQGDYNDNCGLIRRSIDTSNLLQRVAASVEPTRSRRCSVVLGRGDHHSY